MIGHIGQMGLMTDDRRRRTDDRRQIGKRRINLHYFTIIEPLPLKKAMARVGDSPGPVLFFWLGWPGWDKILREK
jgi:hypothetical protein